MNRKSLAALVAVAGFFLFVGRAYADNISDKITDIATWERNGSSNTVAAIGSNGQLNMQDGLVTNHETCQITSSISINAVFVTPALATATLIAGDTTYTGGFTNPNYPHALTFVLQFSSASPYLSNGTSTATIVGVSAKGEVITETVYVTTNIGKSNNAFATVSSMTFLAISSVPINALHGRYYVGSTTTYGLDGSIETANDVFKVRAWGIDASSVTANATYDTISFPPNSAPSPFDVWNRNTRSAPPRPK